MINKIDNIVKKIMVTDIKIKMLEKEEQGLIISKEIVLEILKELTDTTEFQWETVGEAEEWYEQNVNTESNNMNPAFEGARDAWLENNADDIRESYEENHPVVKDDDIGRDNQLDR